MILKALREGLGRIIVFINFITRPSKLIRSEEAQKKADKQTKGMALYQFYACPFCVRVRRTIHRLNLSIETKDAQNDKEQREELLKEGGKIKVPCLRIEENEEVQWMYESENIIKYLDDQFANPMKLEV